MSGKGGGFMLGLMILLGAGALTYGQIEASDRAAEGALVAKLATDDAAQTADALVQAHDMGLLRLSFEERDRLLAVLDRDLRAAVADTGTPVRRSLAGASPEALADTLAGPDRQARLDAARAIAVERRDDAQMTAAMISVLERQVPASSAADGSSGFGVHNLIFALDRQERASWTDELRQRCVDAIQALSDAEAIAPPTQSMAAALSARLQAGLGAGS